MYDFRLYFMRCSNTKCKYRIFRGTIDITKIHGNLPNLWPQNISIILLSINQQLQLLFVSTNLLETLRFFFLLLVVFPLSYYMIHKMYSVRTAFVCLLKLFLSESGNSFKANKIWSFHDFVESQREIRFSKFLRVGRYS